jgi:thiol-disulfide isomerase/thioredoxin
MKSCTINYLALLLLPLLAHVTGCGSPADTSQSGKMHAAASSSPPIASSTASSAEQKSDVGKLTTAHAVLEKMAEAYHNAQSYEDFGTAALFEDGVDKPQRASFQVIFQRPNKLCMKFYNGELTCDGKKWFGFSKEIPDQVVLRDAPTKITMPLLMVDTALGNALNGGFFGGSPQILLLLEENPLEIMLPDVRDQDLTLEEPVRVGDYECYRVRFRRAEGVGEYWIDAKSFVLRHMEFHMTEPSHESTTPGGGMHTEADFERARLGGPIDPAAFKFEVPDGVQTHRALMDVGPYQVIGKKLADFQLADVHGKPWKSESLAGKIAVLQFWQTDIPACAGVVPSLQAAYEKFKDNPRVTFWAINLNGSQVETKTIEETARQWKMTLPVLRDVNWESPKSLKIAAAPVTFFIDSKGVLQDCILGELPVSTAATSRKIEELLDGKDLATRAVKEYYEHFKNYEDGVDKIFAGDAETTAVRVAEGATAAKSAPTKLKLQPLWQLKWDLQRRPGNILVLQDPSGRPRIFVIDGGAAIVELGLDGKRVSTFAPKLAEGEYFTNLRSAAGRDGKRFVAAFAAGQQRFHLFDDKFNYLSSIPGDALKSNHTGISDVTLGELNGDGVLKAYVGFFGTVGVKCISLEDKVLSSCRNVFNVNKLAPGPADSHGRRELFCGNDANNIAILDDKLQPRASARLPADGTLYGLAQADLAEDGRHTWCCVLFAGDSRTTSGQFTAIGLSESGEFQWRRQLPAGTLQTAEPIVVGRVLPGTASQWILPGCDGSIHILAADGALIDRFNYGAPINGLATVEIDGKPVLLISSANGVEALRLE